MRSYEKASAVLDGTGPDALRDGMRDFGKSMPGLAAGDGCRFFKAMGDYARSAARTAILSGMVIASAMGAMPANAGAIQHEAPMVSYSMRQAGIDEGRQLLAEVGLSLVEMKDHGIRGDEDVSWLRDTARLYTLKHNAEHGLSNDPARPDTRALQEATGLSEGRIMDFLDGRQPVFQTFGSIDPQTVLDGLSSMSTPDIAPQKIDHVDLEDNAVRVSFTNGDGFSGQRLSWEGISVELRFDNPSSPGRPTSGKLVYQDATREGAETVSQDLSPAQTGKMWATVMSHMDMHPETVMSQGERAEIKTVAQSAHRQARPRMQ